MQIKEFDILLDIKKSNKIGYIEVVQGDSFSNVFNITLTNGLNAFNLTGTNVEIVFSKSDGTTVQQTDIAILNEITGKIQCVLKTNTIACPGKVAAEVRVLEGETLLTSTRFEFYVRKALMNDDTIESTNEFPLLTQLLNETNEALTEMEEAEELRNTNEVTRQDNETTRQSNETDRVNAENARTVAFAEYENRISTVEDDLIEHKLEYAEDKQPFHFNHVAQEYVNIDKFWDSFKNGKIYTVEFNQFNISPSSIGTKKDDNAGLICEPSTNTIRGRNDYEKIGLFMSIDVNAYVDENGDYHVIAIKGDGRFTNDGTMGDVYVMAMTGYVKYYETDTVWGISYSDTMHAGFEVIHEAEKIDGTIRPYLLHAKYVAGRNPHENNNLASISGVYPEFVNMSHNGQIIEFKKKGVQYSGKTSHDDYYVQLMMWLKYATTNSGSIMKGCQSYYLQYNNLVPETGVKRVIITNAQANNLLVGSTVSIGDYEGSTKTDDRQQVRNYNKANRVNITNIEDLGNGNSAVYVDTLSTFDTTLTTTITTYPWNSGSCDNVLGQDGSPYNNLSGKEPFIINGIEMMVGGYEVLQNLIIFNNAADNRIDVYANYDCTTYATSLTSNHDLVGQIVATNNIWKYIGKVEIKPKHPSIILPVEAEASSTTGFADGIYSNPPSAGGTRAWRSLGGLAGGALCGLRCLSALGSLTDADWSFLGRLSATGQSRRRAGVN